ncbi:hypothetical protein HanPSC8_Chr16g0729121 [Helianthus annuus]|nr:hypothetical protein HanPSC8_Chr16g0729121 [Helianthus annuus]
MIDFQWFADFGYGTLRYIFIYLMMVQFISENNVWQLLESQPDVKTCWRRDSGVPTGEYEPFPKQWK